MEKEKLIEKALKLEKILTEKRGYASGVTKEFLEILPIETLKRNNAKMEKDFRKFGWL